MPGSCSLWLNISILALKRSNSTDTKPANFPSWSAGIKISHSHFCLSIPEGPGRGTSNIFCTKKYSKSDATLMQIKLNLHFWMAPSMENNQRKLLSFLLTSALTWLNKIWDRQLYCHAISGTMPRQVSVHFCITILHLLEHADWMTNPALTNQWAQGPFLPFLQQGDFAKEKEKSYHSALLKQVWVTDSGTATCSY